MTPMTPRIPDPGFNLSSNDHLLPGGADRGVVCHLGFSPHQADTTFGEADLAASTASVITLPGPGIVDFDDVAMLNGLAIHRSSSPADDAATNPDMHIEQDLPERS